MNRLPETCDGARALTIAHEARQAGLAAALRAYPAMPLDQLIRLVASSKYAEDLGQLRIEELCAGAVDSLRPARSEVVEDAVLEIFRRLSGEWLSAGFFVRYLGLERWTAQKICGELAERGLLERRGRTSGTRYRFLAESS